MTVGQLEEGLQPVVSVLRNSFDFLPILGVGDNIEQ